MTAAAPRWIPPMGWGGTLVSFGAPALVLLVTTRIAIPSVSQQLGLPPVLWFIAFSVVYVLAPLLVIALLRLRGESLEDVAVRRERLRFRALDSADWKWALGAVAVSGLCSAALFALLRALGVAELTPSFVANSGEQALAPNDLLIAWSVLGIVSVLAQEVLWRGVYLPRQEQAFGSHAWAANAAGWALFLLPLGWSLALTALPALVSVPYTAQRRQSSSVGAVVHTGAWATLGALAGLYQQM